MKIQINTDQNIEGSEGYTAHVDSVVAKALSHYSAHISRVEVHLSDENGAKDGQNDKRCMIEARVEGRPPTAVTCDAATMERAISGAADKLKNALSSTIGRLNEHR